MEGTLILSLPCLLLGFLGTISWTNANDDWSFQEADKWPEDFPACGGNEQSPINFMPDSAIRDQTFPELKFSCWYKRKPGKVSIKNTGHTAAVTIGETATVSGGPLNGIYKFHEFHFHWGSKDTQGADHNVNCNSFSLETHFVHYNTIYSSFQEALGKKGGVAVLGFWTNASPKRRATNHAMLSVTKALKRIKYKDQTTSFSLDHSLMTFFPDDLTSYFTYQGSLTTPPCLQNITWIVFTQPQSINTRQMEEFRALYEETKDSSELNNLVDNFRNVQPINGRPIYLVGPDVDFPPDEC